LKTKKIKKEMFRRILNLTLETQASKYFLLGLVLLLLVPTFVFGAVATQNIKITVNGYDHCTDGIKNFDETGVDCGGTICSSCSAHCSNSIKDFDETGIDCGGALCPACSSGGGGGGGGGGLPVLISSVNFSGIAYPGAKIYLLRDGILLNSFLATSAGTFAYTLSSVAAGNYRYTFYAQDSRGGYSTSLVFPLTVISGHSYQVSNIFIPPTVYYDSQEIKRGDSLPFYGFSAPNSTIILELKNTATGATITFQTTSNSSGNYAYSLETLGLDEGNYEIRVKAKLGTNESSFGNIFSFTIGTKTVEKPKTDSKCPAKGDLNGDCRVNLIDFSIAAYWYKRTIAPSFINTENSQLSGDNIINLIDFSILAYY